MIWSSDVHASWQDVMTAINDDYWDTLRSGSTYHGKPSRIERCKGRTSTFHLCNGDPIEKGDIVTRVVRRASLIASRVNEEISINGSSIVEDVSYIGSAY